MTDPPPERDREAIDDSRRATEAVGTAISTDYKVRGRLDTPGGTGVLGHNTATSGQSLGVEGVTDSSQAGAAGVRGAAVAGSGRTYGVRGVATSSDDGAAGLYGEQGGGGVGVLGELYGTKSNLPGTFSGLGAAVLGRAEGVDNRGAYFRSVDADGIVGRTDATSSAGIRASNAGAGPGLSVTDSHVDIDHSGAEAYLSTNQTIPDDSTTIVAFDAAPVDPWGGFDTATGRFTVPAAGDYHVSTALGWYFTLRGAVQHTPQIRVNGGVEAQRYHQEPGSSNEASFVTEHLSKTLFELVAGDIVDIRINQDSGSSEELAAGRANSYVTIHKVG